MANNIQRFIADINQRGIATSDRVEVEINRPIGLMKANDGQPLGMSEQSASENLKFRCISGEFPGRNITSNDLRTVGPISRVGYGQSMVEVSLGILLSHNLMEKVFFESWQELVSGWGVHGHNTSYVPDYSVGYYDDYKSTVNINQYNNINQVTYSCQLIDAWPISMTPTTYDWNNTTHQVLNVQMTYSRWVRRSYLDTNMTGIS
jgi:hypothetical protein